MDRLVSSICTITNYKLLIGRKISMIFNQTMCGHLIGKTKCHLI